ncbi:MAG: methylmalonic aciduria and homocystinuria type D protein [Cyanobacteria bacterium J06621_8]
MDTPLYRANYITPSGTGSEIWISPPHQFAREHQNHWFPGWDHPLANLVIVLQESAVSFSNNTIQVTQEKDRRRGKFLSFSFDLVSALQTEDYLGDLFDPRTGFPIFSSSKMVWDDNAAIKALLNYPVITWQNCSLVQHPVWKSKVYPGTVATSAPQTVIKSCLAQIMPQYGWESQRTLTRLLDKI